MFSFGGSRSDGIGPYTTGRVGCAEEFWEQARLQLAEFGAPTTSSDLVVDSDDFAEAPNAEPKSGNEPP
jgi:hypothetical protein